MDIKTLADKIFDLELYLENHLDLSSEEELEVEQQIYALTEIALKNFGPMGMIEIDGIIQEKINELFDNK